MKKGVLFIIYVSMLVLAFGFICFFYLKINNKFSNISTLSDIPEYALSFKKDDGEQLFFNYLQSYNFLQKYEFSDKANPRSTEEEIKAITNWQPVEKITIHLTDEEQSYFQIIKDIDTKEVNGSVGYMFITETKTLHLYIHLSSEMLEASSPELINIIASALCLQSLFYSTSPYSTYREMFTSHFVAEDYQSLINGGVSFLNVEKMTESIPFYKKLFSLLVKEVKAYWVCGGNVACDNGDGTYSCSGCWEHCDAMGCACVNWGAMCGGAGYGCSGCYYFWVDPPPPPPPPPDCVFNCGDMDCCTSAGESSSNCPADCGTSDCWYCESSYSCVLGDPPSGTPCGCSSCIQGTIGGLVFWDKNGNGVWDGDATDARVITSEANRACGDFGQPDVVIPGLQVVGGGKFGSAIAVDNNCDVLNDYRPACATKRCATPGTSDGRCWNCGDTCFTEGIGYRDAELWSWCGGEIARSCFTQWYNSCKSSPFCGAEKENQAGTWVKAFVPYNDDNPVYDNTLLRNRIFTKNVSVGTYQLQLLNLPAGWETAASQPNVTAVNSGIGNCSSSPAYFALRRNYACTINLITPPNGISIGQSTDGIVYIANVVPSDASIDNVIFSITSGTSVSLSNPEEGQPDNDPAFMVTITGESVGASTIEAIATMNDGVTTCSGQAVVTVNESPWFQTQGGNVTTDGALRSLLPAGEFLVKSGSNANSTLTRDPGVVVYNTSPSLGGGSPSAEGWLAGSDYQGYVYTYSFFKNRLASGIFNVNIGDENMQAADWNGGDSYNNYEWYFYDATSQALEINEPIDFGARKVVLFVEKGDLAINAPINLLDGKGFFLAIVEGRIIVNPLVGGPISLGSTPHLEGLFFSSSFQTPSQTPTADQPLYLRGSVVANTFRLLRTLQVDNATLPAEYLEQAPDLLFLYPAALAARTMEWKEVAP